MFTQIHKTLLAGLFLVISSPVQCFALESSSYTIRDDFPNYIGNTQISTNYSLQGDSTWHRQPVTGARFSIVPSAVSTVTSAASSATTSNANNDSNGVRSETITNQNNANNSDASVLISSSVSSQSSSLHPAATLSSSQSNEQEESNAASEYSNSNTEGTTYNPSQTHSNAFEQEQYLASLFIETRKELTDRETVFKYHNAADEEQNSSAINNSESSKSNVYTENVQQISQKCCNKCEPALHYLTQYYLFALLLFIDCIFILLFFRLRCEYNRSLADVRQSCNNSKNA